jgi:hypothetical protein
MSKKLELGRGWFSRATDDEVEILRIWDRVKGKRKIYQIGFKFVLSNIQYVLPKSQFLATFRRKQDENNRH